MLNTTVGRAEYEDDINDCFESVPASYVLAPLFVEDGSAMIVGDRGSGKTRLIRLLSREVPIDVYHLDKEKLNSGTIAYKQISKAATPAATVVDDVHYLLKAMQASNMNGGSIKESYVLEKLEGFEAESKDSESKLIVVADEGPGSLSLRFTGNDNRKRFLSILDGAVDSGDDLHFYRKYLGSFHDRTNTRVVNLNRRGLQSQYTMMKHRMIPTKTATRLWNDAIFQDWAGSWRGSGFSKEESKSRFKEIAEKDSLTGHGVFIQDLVNKHYHQVCKAAINAAGNISKTFGMTDIPYAYDRAPYFSTYAIIDGYVVSNHVMSREGGGTIVTPNKTMATIRELKTLSKALGDINKDNLGLTNIGIGNNNWFTSNDASKLLGKFAEDGISIGGKLTGVTYSHEDIAEIRSTISDRYWKTIDYDPQNLVDAFLISGSDSDFHTAMLEMDLELE